MKLYKYKKGPNIALWALFIVGAFVLCFTPGHSMWIKVLSVFMVIAWPLQQFTWTIGIDSEGIVSLYSLGGRIFKIYKRINFQDIATVQLNERDRVVVYPLQDTPHKFKNLIMIPGNIAMRRELLYELAKSTNKITDEVGALINKSNQHIDLTVKTLGD